MFSSLFLSPEDLNSLNENAVRVLCMYMGNTAAALWPLVLWEITVIGLARSGSWHRIAGLAQEAARGWWEIKTSLNANCHREEDTQGERGGSVKEKDIILMLARCSHTHIFCFFKWKILQGVFQSSLLIYHLLFFHWKWCNVPLSSIHAHFQPKRAKGQRARHIPEHGNKEQATGGMMGEARMSQDKEKERGRRSAGCCFNKPLRWRTSFLCASANEIRALIVLTLSTGYDWALCYLNHIYVPVLLSLRDTHLYQITDCVHVAAPHGFIALLWGHKNMTGGLHVVIKITQEPRRPENNTKVMKHLFLNLVASCGRRPLNFLGFAQEGTRVKVRMFASFLSCFGICV